MDSNGGRRDPRGNERDMPNRNGAKNGVGVLGIALLSALAGGLLGYLMWGESNSSDKNQERERERESTKKDYYRMPPREEGGMVPTARRADSSSHVHAQEGKEEEDSDRGAARCVCCLSDPPTFMFESCSHLCVCETCLINMGRCYEDEVLHRNFHGPVKMPCPMCRKVGYVMRIYSS